MSYLFDRLTFFTRSRESFSDGHVEKIVDDRQWEQAYRNRWRHDKIIRSTHGVSMLASCYQLGQVVAARIDVMDCVPRVPGIRE